MTLAFDVLLKRDLGAGKQTHRYVWFADRGETARDRVIELSHNQFVLDFRGSRCNVVQTVVAH